MPNTMISTVLVVEDDSLVRMYGSDILEEAGYQILEASDADEALAILEQNNDVHLVFSDVDMPGTMNGLGFGKLVYDRWPHIHILLTSGHHRLLDADMPGESKFVRKPWTSEALITRIRELV